MTVVCAEPNWLLLQSLKKKVKKIKPDVSLYKFRNTVNALDYIKKHGCDVLITEIDFGADKEEGIYLARKSMEVNPHLNIIFITARSAKDYAQQLVQIKYSGFLSKPYDFDELLQEFQNLRYS